MEHNRNTQPCENITRGVCRLLCEMGQQVLCEFRLTSSRRVDILAIDRTGRFTIVEVKSSLSDFRGDHKWPEYIPYCDCFYFAVNTDFPNDALPTEHGLIVADRYDAIIHRTGGAHPMNPQRRRAQTLRFARTAAGRLQRRLDPVHSD